ncbi:uncharacterized protein LOC131931435 isoform X2 [Physella acuta]|nr:uncharacterized protein LOC131931435 isoform X2 [Physella acuta]
MGVSMMIGPAISMLLKMLSLRQVTILGSLISACGFVASAFAPNVYVLMFTFGIMGGIGIGMVFLPAIIVVGLYFNKKRAIATGIATSGSGLGTFVYAYITDMLLQHYHWRGTVLILGALLLNCMVCAMLFRPLVAKKRQAKLVDFKTYQADGTSNSDTSSSTAYQQLNKVSLLKETAGQTHNESLGGSGDKGGHYRYNDDSSNNKGSYSHEKTSQQYSIPPENLTETAIGERGQYSSLQGSVKNNISEETNYSDTSNGASKLYTELKEITTLDKINRHAESCVNSNCDICLEKEGQNNNSIDACCLEQANFIPMKLFKNKIFDLLLIAFIMWTAQSIFMMYLPDFAVSQDIERSDAAFLISIVGISNIIGRLLAGFVTDCCHVPSIGLYSVALLSAACVILAVPFCTTLPLIQACSGFFGLCMAVAVSLRTVVLAEQLGIHALTESFGVVALFQGIAFVVNPPIAGKLLDEFHSFKPPFIMAASMYVVSGMASLCVGSLNRKHSRNIPLKEETIVVMEKQ